MMLKILLADSTGDFLNISVTITAPDGTTETFMPIDMTLVEFWRISIPGQAQIVGHLEFITNCNKLGTIQ